MAQVGIGDQYILPLGAMHAAKPGDKILVFIPRTVMSSGTTTAIVVPLSTIDFVIPFPIGAVTVTTDPLTAAIGVSGSNSTVTITGTNGLSTAVGAIVVGTVAFN